MKEENKTIPFKVKDPKPRSFTIPHEVVMRPTEDSTDILISGAESSDGTPHHREFYGDAWLDRGDVYQHLFIVGVTFPKVGEWFMNRNKYPQLANENNITSLTDTELVIIATTDKTLEGVEIIPYEITKRYIVDGAEGVIEIEYTEATIDTLW